MAKETEDKNWAQTQFRLEDGPDDFVISSGFASVTRTGLGVYVATLDSGIDQAEEVLELCASADPKLLSFRQAIVNKDSDVQYTIRTFDSGAAAADAPIGFSVHRVRHTATP